MANYSYLCVTNEATTYPSFVQSDYDPQLQTIACDVWCVPLLWLALFRESDIVVRDFDTDEGPTHTEAPLVERIDAIGKLRAALPFFDRVFADEGSLGEFAGFLVQALEQVDYTYITIELQEISALTDEDAYHAKFREALRSISGEVTPEVKNRFIEIAQLRPGRKLPPARLLLDRLDAEKDDFWNFCRVCGAGEYEAGIGRPVPWEPT